jgi:hypothetical protein
MCWTPLYGNKHKQRKQDMNPPTGGKYEPNIVLCGNRDGYHDTELRT